MGQTSRLGIWIKDTAIRKQSNMIPSASMMEMTNSRNSVIFFSMLAMTCCIETSFYNGLFRESNLLKIYG